MRNDLQQSLDRSHIDPWKLSPFQRILLTTDGTVTDILEAYCSEQIKMSKLSEETITLNQDIKPMLLNSGSQVIDRKILLTGKISRRNYIYAESILALDRLDESVKNDLLKTKIPMGKVWLEHRLETFKEIIDSGKETAKNIAQYFNINPQDYLLFRTYCVFTKGKPTIMITEKFPDSYFL